jgi:hypothetical protein
VGFGLPLKLLSLLIRGLPPMKTVLSYPWPPKQKQRNDNKRGETMEGQRGEEQSFVQTNGDWRRVQPLSWQWTRRKWRTWRGLFYKYYKRPMKLGTIDPGVYIWMPDILLLFRLLCNNLVIMSDLHKFGNTALFSPLQKDHVMVQNWPLDSITFVRHVFLSDGQK